MNWLVTIVVGGIVGWLASIVMKTNAQMGIDRERHRGHHRVEPGLLARRHAGALGVRPDHRLGDRGDRRRPADLHPEGARGLQVGSNPVAAGRRRASPGRAGRLTGGRGSGSGEPAGGRTAGSARRAAAPGGRAREGRELLLHPLLTTLRAGDPFAALTHAAQDLEAALATRTAVLVERHSRVSSRGVFLFPRLRRAAGLQVTPAPTMEARARCPSAHAGAPGAPVVRPQGRRPSRSVERSFQTDYPSGPRASGTGATP